MEKTIGHADPNVQDNSKQDLDKLNMVRARAWLKKRGAKKALINCPSSYLKSEDNP